MTCSRVVRFGHAAAEIAVLRLHNDGQANFLSGFPGIIGVLNCASVGRGHADGLQHLASELLVFGDRLGDGTGLVGFGGPDLPLTRTISQLHEVLPVDPADGNAAALRGLDDRPGAGPQANIMGQRT